MAKDINEIVVGLDIGTTKIFVMVGRKNEHGKLEVLGTGSSESLGVQRGEVVNIKDTVSAIKSAVAKASEDSKVDIKVVNVGIAGYHIRSMQQRGMLMRPNFRDEITDHDVLELISKMKKLQMPPGYEIIHCLPQEYVVDDRIGIKDPVGMYGSKIEANFHIITGHISAAQMIYHCVEQAGLAIEDLILEPLASSESVLTAEEKEAGVVLVDIGGGTTDIAIFQDGIIRHSAVLPFGGNIITEDIRTGCAVLQRDAEKLKVSYGNALASQVNESHVVSIPGLTGRPPKEISLKNLAAIIQARVKEIFSFVMREVAASGYERKLIAGMVITGGGAMLKNLKLLVEFETGMEVRIGSPTEHLAKTDRNLHHPMYATGVGLVLQGINNNHSLNHDPQSVKPEEVVSDPPRGKFFEKMLGFLSNSKEKMVNILSDDDLSEFQK